MQQIEKCQELRHPLLTRQEGQKEKYRAIALQNKGWRASFSLLQEDTWRHLIGFDKEKWQHWRNSTEDKWQDLIGSDKDKWKVR